MWKMRVTQKKEKIIRQASSVCTESEGVVGAPVQYIHSIRIRIGSCAFESLRCQDFWYESLKKQG